MREEEKRRKIYYFYRLSHDINACNFIAISIKFQGYKQPIEISK